MLVGHVVVCGSSVCGSGVDVVRSPPTHGPPLSSQLPNDWVNPKPAFLPANEVLDEAAESGSTQTVSTSA